MMLETLCLLNSWYILPLTTGETRLHKGDNTTTSPACPFLVFELMGLTTTTPKTLCVSIEQAVDLAGELEAQKTFLVGLGGDIEYHETNAMLESQEKELGAPNVRLAHDGLAVDIDLG